MLLGGGVTVADAAQACGFESPTSFTAAFTRRFGRPPGAIAKSQE
jgi:AraC-like DNA-binding protein